MRCSKRLIIAFYLLLATGLASAQQLSLGNTPSVLTKSAVLELNSAKQGLLLPRLSDTTAINALNPPDGMLIYFNPTKQIFIRANGHWNALAFSTSLNNYWNVDGNANGALKKLGTTDNYDLLFISANAERMRLTTTGRLGIGISNPSALLHVSGTNPLTLNGVQNGGTTTADSLLTINNGTVQKLPVATFQSMLNGTGFVKASGTTITYDNNIYTIANSPITASTKTKITYDAKGLVTAGADATTADIAEGSNLYYTDARVRAAALTGLSTSTATAVTATDNVLAGVGKLQGQINAINGAGYLTSETDPLAAKKANNLSDLANVGAARTNLGATTAGSNFFTLTNPSAVTFPRINADNSVSALDAATFRTAIGAGTGSGSVSSVSVTSANGFAGTVATATSTPAITLSTTVTGLLKGNGAAISAAVAGTDYQSPITLPYAINRYYNGYGAFAGLNSDSVAQGSTNLFATSAEKSAWNTKESVVVAPYATNRYWNGYKQFVSLNTDSIAEGSTNLFFTAARVRTTALTGLSTATATAVTASDNLLAGIGKLQGQINTINGAGYQTGNQSITFTAGGDASGSASGTTLLSPSLTVTGLRGAALPSLSTGLLKYNGSAWAFDNSSYLTSESSTLANVTGRGNTTSTGINLTQNGNLSTSYGLYVKRSTDVSPSGNLILAQNAAASGDLFKVDAAGNTTATSFIKSGGTASQFLKADGSVDNTSYLTGNQSIALSGDVSGSGSTAITTAIGANKVTLNHMAQVATGTFLGRTTAGTGNVEALTAAQAKTLLGIAGSNSGDVSLSGQNYLSLSGQTITANAVDLSGTHVTGTLAAARFGALTGDVTNTAGSYATTITNGAVTYAKMQNISAANRLLGRATTGAGSTEEITIGSGLSLSGTTLSATGAGYWNTTGNSGTNWASNFLGTTDNASFRFRTNNVQRMIVDSLGNVGIGVSNPSNPLVVKDTLEIRRTGTLSTLLFSNTSGSGDFRIAGDGGDIFWQGGGGRALQMGSYWGMVLGGDRQAGTFPSFIAGTGGTGVLIPAQRSASVPLGLQAAASQTANLTEWRNSSNTVLSAVTSAGNFGIGTATVNAPLQFAPTLASRKIVLFEGANNDHQVYGFGINSSALRYQVGDAAANHIFYAGASATASNELMRIQGNGNVGIGSSSFDVTSPERLLVDAGSSTYTAMLAKGNINSYFQINVKNASTGAQSSSDLVATANNGTETTNFVNLGINGSGYVYQTGNPIETGKANDGYLLSSGNDFYIVNNNAAKDMIFLTGGTAPANEVMRITSGEIVGIGTTTPNASAKLDVSGSVKIGSSGSVIKNMVTAVYTFGSNTAVTAATTSGLGSNIAPGTTDVTYTLPAANTLASTQAAVSVSPSADLPAGVSIAYARATSTTAVKVRFINNSTTTGTIASGTKLYFTITDF